MFKSRGDKVRFLRESIHLIPHRIYDLIRTMMVETGYLSFTIPSIGIHYSSIIINLRSCILYLLNFRKVKI